MYFGVIRVRKHGGGDHGAVLGEHRHLHERVLVGVGGCLELVVEVAARGAVHDGGVGELDEGFGRDAADGHADDRAHGAVAPGRALVQLADVLVSGMVEVVQG